MTEKFEIRLEDTFKAAWALFAKSPEIFITIAFGLCAASLLFSHLPLVGPFLYILITAMGPASYFLAADECQRKGIATFDSLKALPRIFPQLLALFLVKWIVILLGFLCLVIPGIYLAVVLVFSELFVVVEGMSFVDAMKASRALVHHNWFGVFGLCIVAGIVAFSGLLLVGIGILFTGPFAMLMLYCVFRRVYTTPVA